MSKDIDVYFRVRGMRRNGDERDKTFPKINQALEHMWRTKEVQELFLSAIGPWSATTQLVSSITLFAKVGRKRAICCKYAAWGKLQRPGIDVNGATDWAQLPCRFNELE